jgi:hypothetical protein
MPLSAIINTADRSRERGCGPRKRQNNQVHN